MNTQGRFNLQEITQALIAFVMVGVTAWNVAAGRSLPDQWVNMVLLVVGFYFGRAVSDQRNIALPSGAAIVTALTGLALVPVHWFTGLINRA